MDAPTTQALADLTVATTQQTTIEKSIETLLNGLAAQIAALKNTLPNGDDPLVAQAIEAAAAIVKHNNDAVAAAIIANTPQA